MRHLLVAQVGDELEAANCHVLVIALESLQELQVHNDMCCCRCGQVACTWHWRAASQDCLLGSQTIMDKHALFECLSP